MTKNGRKWPKRPHFWQSEHTSLQGGSIVYSSQGKKSTRIFLRQRLRNALHTYVRVNNCNRETSEKVHAGLPD
jgi:hypothetical protein